MKCNNNLLLLIDTKTNVKYTNQLQSVSTQKIESSIDINNKEDCVQFEYTFNINDTLLHSMLGETKAEKIRKIIEHKSMIVLLIITLVILNLAQMSLGHLHFVYNMYSISLL
eukprot:158069_1